MASLLRVSDADRERVAEQLAHGWSEGFLSFETFSRRVDAAYRARSWTELRGLVFDLPLGRLGRLTALWNRVRPALVRRPGQKAEDEAAELRLPERPDVSLVLGRAPDCTFRLHDETVSRHHAEIRCEGGVWVISDLASTNGLYVNGRRVWRTELRRGDQVALGRASVVVADESVTR